MNKPTIIFAPPRGSDATCWLPQMEALAGSAKCVFAPLEGDSIDAIAFSILKLVNSHSAGREAAIAGCSLGSFAAIRAAALAPSRITGLFLTGLSLETDPPAQRAAAEAKVAGYPQTGFYPGLPLQQMSLLIHDAANRPELAKRINTVLRRASWETMRQHTQALINRPDQTSDLKRLRSNMPLWVVAGQQDKITPVKDAAAVTKAFGTSARLFPINQCGHLAPVEQPTIVSWAMRGWLNEIKAYARQSPPRSRAVLAL